MVLFRYIIKEHVGPFFFGLSLIVFIFTMNLFFRLLGKIAGKGISVWIIGEYFVLNLAWIIALAVPMAVLIATLSAYGRLAGDGEITALRSSGISPLQMIRPALIGGLLMTLFIGWFNNFMLPDMNHRTKTLWVEMSRKKPTMALEPDIYNFLIPNYVFHVRAVEPDSGYLEGVTIYDEHNPESRASITGENGRLSFAEADEAIILSLNKGEIHRESDRAEDGYEYTQFDSALFRLNAPGMTLKRGSKISRGDREMKVAEMVALVNELKVADERNPGKNYNKRRISSLLVEIHKKFSIPVACLVFILLGAPLGMLASKGGMGVAGAISLLFFTIYWTMLTGGEKLADRGVVPPGISMWIANIVLTVVGLWVLWLSKRRTTFPGMQIASNLLKRIFFPHIDDKDQAGEK